MKSEEPKWTASEAGEVGPDLDRPQANKEGLDRAEFRGDGKDPSFKKSSIEGKKPSCAVLRAEKGDSGCTWSKTDIEEAHAHVAAR